MSGRATVGHGLQQQSVRTMVKEEKALHLTF